MQSVKKRTKSKYSNRQILKILRYNQKRVDESNYNKLLHTITNDTVGKFFGASMFGFTLYDKDINELFMPTTPTEIFKLSRK